jgi:hypothetical protein
VTITKKRRTKVLAKKLAVAAALVLGATSLASAQAGRPGALSYGFGCYGCTYTTTSDSGLYDFAGSGEGQWGTGWQGDRAGLFDEAGSGTAAQPLHTRGNYEYFRSSGPDRGNSIESQR